MGVSGEVGEVQPQDGKFTRTKRKLASAGCLFRNEGPGIVDKTEGLFFNCRHRNREVSIQKNPSGKLGSRELLPYV